MKKLFSLILLVIIFLSSKLYPQYELDNRDVSYPKLLEEEINSESQQNIANSEVLDSLIEATMGTYHIPGISALIVKYDSIVWSRNYGFANLELNHPVEDSTLFFMASISKTVMITALMQLWELGHFNLEDNINDYTQPDFQVINPDHPNDTITIKMLMTHTSSIDDNWIDFLRGLIVCGDSPVPLDTFLINYFTPGGNYYNQNNFLSYSPSDTIWHYTNVGTALLAFMVEKFSEVSFDQYCRDNIFTPLNMNETSWFLEGLDTSRIATMYQWIGSQYIPNCHQGWPSYPPVCLRTNKIELEHFLSTYRNGGTYNGYNLLQSSTIDTMLQVYKYFQPLYSWGLIWFYTILNERGLWGHTGGWEFGANTAMYFHPEEDWGFIMFANIDFDDNAFWYLNGIISDYAHEIVVNIAEKTDLPINYKMFQNYPNPFNPSTKIKYSVPQSSNVEIKIFDILGNEIETLVNEEKQTGTYEISWYAENLPSGVYFYRIQAGSFIETKKMVLMK